MVGKRTFLRNDFATRVQAMTEWLANISGSDLQKKNYQTLQEIFHAAIESGKIVRAKVSLNGKAFISVVSFRRLKAFSRTSIPNTVIERFILFSLFEASS